MELVILLGRPQAVPESTAAVVQAVAGACRGLKILFEASRARWRLDDTRCV